MCSWWWYTAKEEEMMMHADAVKPNGGKRK
jgi:hypothetical protein